MPRPFALVLAFGLAACGAEKTAPRPDVVVLMLDTTRADHLGFSETEPTVRTSPPSTPFLDRLAEESIVFENAWAASTHTSPSTASIFTGLVPPRHGVLANLSRDVELVAIPSSVRTLAQHFSAAGYQTLGVGCNLNLNAERGFHRGFDVFSESRPIHANQMAERLYELVTALDPDRPTYTFMHFMDPHNPYNSRQPWCPHVEEAEQAECNTRCRYRSEISFLDSELEKMFERMGWNEDTIVVVVTDHGEEFGDHGGMMHRFSVHAELARAGLLMRIPGIEPRRTSIPAHHIDILPTLLWALDLPAPETVDGMSLIPALSDGSGEERPLLTHRVQGEETLWGLTVGPWRLLEKQPGGAVSLYHVGKDPGETHDLAAMRPNVVENMRGRLEAYRSGLRPIAREMVSIDLTDQDLDELRRLGYLGEEQ